MDSTRLHHRSTYMDVLFAVLNRVILVSPVCVLVYHDRCHVFRPTKALCDYVMNTRLKRATVEAILEVNICKKGLEKTKIHSKTKIKLSCFSSFLIAKNILYKMKK